MSGLLSEQEAEPESCVLVLNDPFPLAEARAELGVMMAGTSLKRTFRIITAGKLQALYNAGCSS